MIEHLRLARLMNLSVLDLFSRMHSWMFRRSRVLTTGMKRLNSSAAPQPSASEQQGGFWAGFTANAAAVGVYSTILAATCGAAVCAQRAIDSTDKKLAVAEEKINSTERTIKNVTDSTDKKLEVAEQKIKNAELRIKLAEHKTAKEVAEAELRVAEKFLMYGYVEEYSSYQKKALPLKVKVFLILFDSAVSVFS